MSLMKLGRRIQLQDRFTVRLEAQRKFRDEAAARCDDARVSIADFTIARIEAERWQTNNRKLIVAALMEGTQ